MKNIIALFLIIFGLGLTLGILGLGLFSMVRGGDFNAKWGNRIMRWRIMAQAFAIAMFALGLALVKQG